MTIDEARQVIERVTSTMPASPFRDAVLLLMEASQKPASEPVQPVAALARIKAVVRAPVRSADAVGVALADVEALEAWCLSLAGLAMFEDGATLDEALIEMGEDEE